VTSHHKIWPLTLTLALAGMVSAQVPPDIAKQLVEIGRGVCVPQTAKIYRPLHPNPPYKGVTFTRDISFGPDPKDVLDVAVGEKGGGSRPVLIYISGGAGNKLQGGENGDVFYDNIMLWAVKNGMTGVNMQRHPGQAWDDPAKAVRMVVEWVQTNISKYKGNPDRVFAWSQSAGNVPLGTYVGHPELYTAKEVGLKDVVFMSPPAFDILPATPKPVQGGVPACAGGAAGAAQAAAKGGGKGDGKGGDGKGGGGRGKQAVDPATQLARSNLPGLINSKVPFFLSVAELDPPNIMAFAETLRDELCKASRCATYTVFKDHSHISEVMSPDTADTSVSGPILKWMKSVK
jgi:hypothetical protein